MGREAGLRLELFVDDMEASIAFYTRVLAFDLASHELGNYANLRLGSVVLGIGPVAKLHRLLFMMPVCQRLAGQG